MMYHNYTVYVCARCGRTADIGHLQGWLVSRSKKAEDRYYGVLVIRCPQHITRYAIGQAEYGKLSIRK